VTTVHKFYINNSPYNMKTKLQVHVKYEGMLITITCVLDKVFMDENHMTTT